MQAEHLKEKEKKKEKKGKHELQYLGACSSKPVMGCCWLFCVCVCVRVCVCVCVYLYVCAFGGGVSFAYMVHPSSLIASLHLQLASLEVEKHELSEAKKSLEHEHRSRSAETQALAEKVTRLEAALSKASVTSSTLASG